MLSRRWFLGGLGAAVAAPAIVRPGLIMPVRTWIEAPPPLTTTFNTYSAIGNREMLSEIIYWASDYEALVSVAGKPPFRWRSPVADAAVLGDEACLRAAIAEE